MIGSGDEESERGEGPLGHVGGDQGVLQGGGQQGLQVKLHAPAQKYS